MTEDADDEQRIMVSHARRTEGGDMVLYDYWRIVVTHDRLGAVEMMRHLIVQTDAAHRHSHQVTPDA